MAEFEMLDSMYFDKEKKKYTKSYKQFRFNFDGLAKAFELLLSKSSQAQLLDTIQKKAYKEYFEQYIRLADRYLKFDMDLSESQIDSLLRQIHFARKIIEQRL